VLAVDSFHPQAIPNPHLLSSPWGARTKTLEEMEVVVDEPAPAALPQKRIWLVG